MSVRIRSSLILLALIAILISALYIGIQGSRQAAQDAREIEGTSIIHTQASQIESLVRELTNTNIDNETSVAVLNNRIESTTAINTSIVRYFNASSSINRSQFAAFLATATLTNPEILGVGYIQKIDAQDRAEFEASIQAEGFENFSIFNLSPADQPSETPEFYYPLLYVEPFETTRFAFGFDFISTPTFATAMDLARDTNSTVLAPPTSISVSETQQLELFVFFTPIYSSSDPLNIDERRSELVGFSLTALDIAQVVNQVIENIPVQTSIVAINDITEAEAGLTQNIYTAPNTNANTDVANFTLTIYGRVWEISIQKSAITLETLSTLQATTAELNIRVDSLEGGAESLGFYGLDRHTTSTIVPTYQILKQQKDDLINQINEFTGLTSAAESTRALAEIQTRTAALSATTQELIDLFQAETESHIDTQTRNSFIVGLLALVISIFGFITVFQITNTLIRVSQSAQALATGKEHIPLPVRGRYELAQINQAMNNMAEQLETAFDTLEQRIDQSTGDLQTVIDLNKQVSTILNVEPLLRAATSLAKDRFDLYHAHIYLLDEQHQSLVLAAGSGYIGRQMVSRGQRIPLNSSRSIVAKSAQSRQTIVVDDTTSSPDFLPNPLLPDTQSELATPLISRGQLLGILDVQSEQVEHFTERIISVMELLATQTANALANAQLYETAFKAGQHQRALSNISQVIQQADSVDEVLRSAVREIGIALRVPHTAIELQVNALEENIKS